MADQLHSVVCSAPGKVILFGEHAVVLGKTSIATALGLRTHAFFEESVLDSTNPQATVLKLNFPDLKVEREWSYEQLKPFYSQAPVNVDNLIPDPKTFSNSNKFTFEEFIKSLETLTGEGASSSTTSKGLLAFLYLYFSLQQFNASQRLNRLTVTVRSHLPVGMGLGSSAAFSVSIVAGLVTINSIKLCTSCTVCTPTRPCGQQLKFINDWSFQAERIMHGTPSGIDNTVSTYGGTITLTRTDAEPIKFLEGTPSLPFLLTNTKVPRNTAALVKKVGVFHQEQPEKANPILDEIHSISKRCIESFTSNVPRQELVTLLEGLIDRNQVLLNELGVGHPVLDTVCRVTAQFGLHSKLTGAGGGGCALTLLSNDKVEEAKAALEKEGFECFRADLGGVGVLIKTPEEFISLFGKQ